jgi:hypothetical protein
LTKPAGIPTALAPLVPSRAPQAVGFSVQHRIQGFLDRPAHHLAKLSRICASSIWMTCPIGFGLSFSSILSQSERVDLAVKCENDLERYRAFLGGAGQDRLELGVGHAHEALGSGWCHRDPPSAAQPTLQPQKDV